MKKLLLSILACGTIAAANAQAGSWLLFGQAAVHSTSNDELGGTTTPPVSNTVHWMATPGVGYQFDNHFTLGMYAGYENGGYKAVGTGQPWMRTNDWQAGVFVRYTENLNKIFSVFGQLNTGFIHGNSTQDGKVEDNSRYNGFEIRFNPFIAVNVHKGLALNFGIGGIEYNNKGYENRNNANGSFDLTFGQQFSWGISKNFGGHNRRIHREPGTDRHMKNWRDDDGDAPKKSKNSDNDE
ncbi:MAG: hypothetical protein QM530_06975 [Phycisphaerales bacterium]|nr:hypothetical protein [Phycisphaerales bacterium]